MSDHGTVRDWAIRLCWLVLALALSIALLGPLVSSPDAGPSKQVMCARNLTTLGRVIYTYAVANDGNCLPSLEAVRDEAKLSPRMFLCPAAGSEPSKNKFVSDYDSIFDRAGRPISLAEFEAPSSIPLNLGANRPREIDPIR